MEADVVIIGAGVSGLFAALNLDKHFKVIMIERQPFPPRKLCAGIMADVAYFYIKELDVPASIFHAPQTFRMKIVDEDNNFDYFNNGEYFNFCRKGFYTWMRSLFSNNFILLDQTRPVLIDQQENSVHVQTNGSYNGTIKARYLIGADGILSFARKAAGLKKPGYIHSIQYLMEASKPLEYMEMIFNSELVENYYMWSVPKDKHILTGIMIEKANYKRMLEYAVKRYGLTGRIIKKGTHPIACIKSTSELVTGKQRILLTGEAAGFVRPTSGEGLTFAFRSGLLAAQAIMDFPSDPHEAYKNLCAPIYRELDEDIKMNSFFYNKVARKAFLKQQ